MGKYAGSKEEKIDKLLEKQNKKELYKENIKKADELRQLDEHNPLEQALEFDEVRKNPPEPGYMKVEAYKAVDDSGNKCIMTKSDQPDGIKWIKHNPFFVTDLNTAIMANVARCPSNVGPMLLDQGMKLADLEKHTFKPEKRRDENKIMVVLVILMITISAGAGAFLLFRFLG